MPVFRSKSLIALGLIIALSACGDDPQKMVSSARDYLAKGDTNAATIQLKNALQKNPGLGEARFLFGKILLDSGDAQGAEKELHKALQAGQPMEQVLPLLTWAMLGSGQSKQFLAELPSLVANTANEKAVVATALADTYVVTGQLGKAESAIRDALAANPASVAARISSARLKAVQKDFAGASAIVDEVLAKTPDEYDAVLLRADLRLADNQTDKALEDFTKAAQLKPQNAQPRLRKVQILISKLRFDEAEAELKLVRKVAPNNLQAKLSEGVVALYRNRNEAARDAAQLVLRGAPDLVPALVLAGTAQFRLQDFAQAEALLERALAKAPQADGVRRLLARTYLATRESGRAIELLKPLLEQAAPDQQTLLLAGQAAIQSGDFARSTEFFAKAAASDPKDAMAKTRLGMSRMMGGDVEAGIHELEGAAALSQDGTDASLALVMAHLNRGDKVKAKAAADELVKKAPGKPMPYNVLGGVLSASKDLAGARQAFEKALSIDPTYLPAAINLSRLDLSQGKLADAKARFQRVIDKNPKLTEAYLGLARLMTESNAKPDEVRKVIDRAITANSAALAPRLALIDWFQRQGDRKSALSTASELVSAFPNDPSALAAAASAQVQAGDAQQSVATLNRLVKLQPKSASALILLADAQRLAKDPAAAEETLHRAVKLQPNFLDAQQRLFAIKMDARRFDDAIGIAREIQQQRPKIPVGFFLEGDARGLNKDWPGATKSFSKALELAQEPGIAAKLHNAMLESGAKADAGKLATGWIASHPKDTGFRAYLAERALAVKDYPEAARLYHVLVDLDPKNAVMLNNLAWVAGQTKDPKAISYIDRALDLAPNSPPLLDTKAGLLDAAGQQGKARDMWRQAIALAPNNGEIRLNLARALAKSGSKESARSEIDQLLKIAPEGSVSRREAEALAKTL